MELELKDNRTETQEVDKVNKALLLAGLIETGGSLRLRVYEFRNFCNVYPIISLNDTDKKKLGKLKQIYGGGHNKERGNSRQWKVSGDKAVELALASEPYAPSRKAIIQAFRSVKEDGMSFEQKKELSHSFRGIQRITNLSPDIYAPLVVNPAFLAGVLYAREAFHLSEKWHPEAKFPYSMNYPGIDISSDNKALLDALHLKYGGSNVSTRYRAGQQTLIKGVPILIRRDSFRWTAEGKTAIALHSLSAKFL